MDKMFYSVKEVIELLGVSRSLVYKALDRDIPIIRLGRKILVPASYIKKLTEER